MNILVTGGTGAIGLALLPRLINKGCSIKLLTLPDEPGIQNIGDSNIEVCPGDITVIESLEKHFDNIDTVIHMAAEILNPLNPHKLWKVNVNGTRNLLSLSSKYHIQHFVYVSSISVTYPVSNHYSRSKAAAEKLVTGYSAGNQTIIRPSLVYCENGGQEFMIFVNHLKNSKIVPFAGKGNAKKSPVFLDDLAAAIAEIPGNPGTYGKIYNLAGKEPISLRQMADLLLNHMGKPKLILPVPVFLCRLMSLLGVFTSKFTGKAPIITKQTLTGLTQDAVPDIRAAQEDLYFSPRNFSCGLQELRNLRNCLKPGIH